MQCGKDEVDRPEERARLPSLTALRAFEAAARHTSFREAADELCVTHSAVSHQIKELERSLGVALFLRLGRRVELSEAGRLLFPILRDAFDRIAEGTGLVQRSGHASELTLQVYVTVAVRWLIPRLHRFEQRHPDVRLRLSTTARGWAFDLGNVDAGIIHAEPPLDPRAACWPLFEAKLVPAVGPALAPSGGPGRAADALDYRWLQVEPGARDWATWLAVTGLDGFSGRGSLLFDSYLLAIEAAVEGAGLALIPDFMIASELRSGRLVQPFGPSVRQAGAWYLACRKERAADPLIGRFRSWLEAEVAADPLLEPASAQGASPEP